VFVLCVAIALIAAWRSKPKHVDANLARGEVLVFDANWCGACRAMKPVVAQLQGEGFDIREVDVDKNRADAMRFSVHSIPTFILVRDGQEVRRGHAGRKRATIVPLKRNKMAGVVGTIVAMVSDPSAISS
jgi:thioredoxin 1